ncbi:hypothetical protein N7520_010357 [Penicillium odoratum]|uniref:uncharacterized protein n=1 Tax=Penicillium odoratum TaxID=1167516 RepID=UPI002547D93B|nr:uncharacterized protein N7520_010357 [Penicillium odoratum]KAJ5745175.1 hypothetical protein N7520_010357 [Penicillium odoratum]
MPGFWLLDVHTTHPRLQLQLDLEALAWMRPASAGEIATVHFPTAEGTEELSRHGNPNAPTWLCCLHIFQYQFQDNDLDETEPQKI